MSGKAFVDTDILLYAHDVADPAKNRRAVELLTQLWADANGVLSTQVLQEFAVNLQRQTSFSLTLQEVQRRILLYLDWEVVVNGGGSVLRGLEVQERYRLSFWDGMKSCRRRRARGVKCCTPRICPMDRNTAACWL